MEFKYTGEVKKNDQGEYTEILVGNAVRRAYKIKHPCLYFFCFFCGWKLGPFCDNEHCIELAKRHNFKRRKHSAYKGRRWLCKRCRVAESSLIKEAELEDSAVMKAIADGK